MICSQCSKGAVENAKFCAECGNALHHVGNLNTDENAIQAANKKRWLWIGVPILLVVFLTVIFTLSYKSIFSLIPFTNHAGYSLFYIKDNELIIRNSRQEEPITATNELIDKNDTKLLQEIKDYNDAIDYFIQLNDAGDRMFFLDKVKNDRTANLYYRNPKTELKDNVIEKGVRLASNISIGDKAFQMSNQGDYVLYMKDYDYETGGSLYLHDLTQEILIDHDVSSFYTFSEDGSQILYMRSEDEETSSLFTVLITNHKEKVKIDHDINQVVEYTPNFETIYYTTKDTNIDRTNDLTLYVKKKEEGKVKLATDINYILSSSETGEFFFTRTYTDEINLFDMVEDDRAVEDKALREPYIEAYQYSEAFTDWRGDVYYQTSVNYDDYYEDVEQYTRKQERDKLRSELMNEHIIQYTNELFMLDNGEETLITDQFSNAIISEAQFKTVIYNKTVEKQQEKLLLSDIYSINDVQIHFWDTVTKSPSSYIIINGGTEREFTAKTDYTSNHKISQDGKKLYYVEKTNEKDLGELVVWDILNDKLENRVVIENNVYNFIVVNDDLYYYKDVKNMVGDLFFYAGGKAEKVNISYDVKVSHSMIYPEDQIVLYLSDFDAEKGMGKLHTFDGTNQLKIADDVSRYYYRNKSSIYYITDFRTRTGKGDLWVYEGNNKKKSVAYSVSGVLAFKKGIQF